MNNIILMVLYYFLVQQLVFCCAFDEKKSSIYKVHSTNGYIAWQNIKVVESVDCFFKCLLHCYYNNICHSVSYSKKINGSCLLFKEFYSENLNITKHADWKSAGVQGN